MRDARNHRSQRCQPFGSYEPCLCLLARAHVASEREQGGLALPFDRHALRLDDEFAAVVAVCSVLAGAQARPGALHLAHAFFEVGPIDWSDISCGDICRKLSRLG